MKRFLVFKIMNHEAAGGMNDFDKSFDTLSEAQEDINNTRGRGFSYQIFDTLESVAYFLEFDMWYQREL